MREQPQPYMASESESESSSSHGQAPAGARARLADWNAKLLPGREREREKERERDTNAHMPPPTKELETRQMALSVHRTGGNIPYQRRLKVDQWLPPKSYDEDNKKLVELCKHLACQPEAALRNCIIKNQHRVTDDEKHLIERSPSWVCPRQTENIAYGTFNDDLESQASGSSDLVRMTSAKEKELYDICKTLGCKPGSLLRQCFKLKKNEHRVDQKQQNIIATSPVSWVCESKRFDKQRINYDDEEEQSGSESDSNSIPDEFTRFYDDKLTKSELNDICRKLECKNEMIKDCSKKRPTLNAKFFNQAQQERNAKDIHTCITYSKPFGATGRALVLLGALGANLTRHTMDRVTKQGNTDLAYDNAKNALGHMHNDGLTLARAESLFMEGLKHNQMNFLGTSQPGMLRKNVERDKKKYMESMKNYERKRQIYNNEKERPSYQATI